MLVPATCAAAKRFTPKGGVIIPIARLTTMIVPKWTPSMPSRCAASARIGASTIMEAEVSTNMPTTNRNRFTASRYDCESSKVFTSHSAAMSGTPWRLSSQENSVAAAMMNMMTAELITDFLKIG
jgi:hypothetical protein